MRSFKAFDFSKTSSQEMRHAMHDVQMYLGSTTIA